nr:maestro heat-like repeat-containing protein family member 2A [Chrysemys picta bellii]
MADTVGQPSGGVRHRISNLLRLADEGGHKDIAAGIMQAARVQPAAVASLLVQILQQDEVSVRQKVAAYEGLRTMLLEQGMEAGLIGSLIAVASQQMRVAPEEALSELQAAASDTLAALAGSYFGPVMRELQKHLRPFVLPAEFTLLTLGKVMAASVYRCVPFLGITLTTMQTVMRGIEDSRRRGAFCTALECMCGAISTYLRSWERSTYPQITLQRFSAYLLPMYQDLISAWLPSEDMEVKLAVLQALGPMLNILLPRKDLQNQIYGDIPLLLAQYGENIEAFYITKVLGQILQASSSNNPIPEVHVEAISHTLSYQVTSKAQRPYRLCRENHTEISHVFLQLARSHPSELLGIFHRKLEMGRGDTRVGILALMSYIIGAEVPGMARWKHLCIKSVKSVLTDGSPRERPMRSLPLGGLLEKMVQKTSLATLEIIIASGRGISQELWVRLLGYVPRTPYTDSMTPLCRCLRILAAQRQQHRQAAHDCREPVASPTPQQLLARLLVLSASPFEGEGRGVAALLLLNALRPEMYGDEAEQWWMEIPAMVQYLDGHSKFSLDQTAWEHKLLEFLQKTLGRSKEGGWSQDLSHELGRQMGSYANASVEKAFLCKALGTALAMSKDVASVTGQLRELLRMADYLNGAETECLDSCLQLCAREQLDAILRALGDFEEEMAEGEDSWHLSLCKGLAPQERDRVKSTLLLFYSSAAAQASPQQLLPRLAEEIVPKILHHYSTSTQALGLNARQMDTALTLRFIESISAVSLAVQRSGESQPHQLPHKQVLLSQLLEIIKAEPRSSLLSPVRQEAMVAIGHLSKVKQPLSCEKNQELMEQCLDSVFSLPPQEFTEDVGPSQTLYASTMATLEGLMQILLEEEETPERLQRTFRLLQRWLVSEQVWERARAMRVSTHLLKAYLQTVTITTQIPPGQFSTLAGTLGPYTCDSLGSIRQGAGDAIGCLLDIQVAKQPWTLRGRDKAWALRRVCQELQSADPEEVWDASIKLAKLVSRALPKAEILPFTQTLLESLGAVSQACDQASVLWFHTLLTDRASDLTDTVQAILSITSTYLRCLEDPEPRGLLTQAVSLLAQHHQEAVVTYLLQRPLPLDKDSKELWAALAAEDFFQDILKDLLDRIPSGPAAEQGAETQEVAVANPLSVVCAIGEVVMGTAVGDALGSLLPELCYALLYQLSCTPDSDTPLPSRAGRPLASPKGAALPPSTPRSLTVVALRAVLAKGLQDVARTLDKERGWHLLEDPRSFPEGVSLLARALGQVGDAPLDRILQLLSPSLSSPCEDWRVTGTAFYAELLGHPGLQQRKLLRPVLEHLVAGASDESDSIRRLAARGLGNMAQGLPHKY